MQTKKKEKKLQKSETETETLITALTVIKRFAEKYNAELYANN